jgi:hypothetical protein
VQPSRFHSFLRIENACGRWARTPAPAPNDKVD